MFEVNLLSSDDVEPPAVTPVKRVQPEVIDLLSSSPIALFPSQPHSPLQRIPGAPVHPQQQQCKSLLSPEADSLEPRGCTPPPKTHRLDLTSSPILSAHKSCSSPAALNAIDPNSHVSAHDSATRKPAANSKSRRGTQRATTAPKRFKAAKTVSTPAALKLVTDRKKACIGCKCLIWERDNHWSTLLQNAFATAEVTASCEPTPSAVELEGVSAIITVHGEFSDAWESEQQLFIKASPHTEVMNTHIVVLHASHLDTLGKLDRASRKAFFDKISQTIRASGVCIATFDIMYVVPEVHLQFRKMMAAYDRRLRQRVVDHSNGRDVAIEQPPPQHYFNEVQVRLLVENGIRAVYPRNTAEAAEIIVNWIIDLCFSRYRVQTDASLEGLGGAVRSKSAVPEITAEALAVVHGLPPRIASSIAGDMKSLGKLYSRMGTNTQQQMTRLRYYGKGDWNESLVALLSCDNPEQTIGQV